MSAQLSIGNELKDSFKTTITWVNANVKWLNEIESFYKERSKIEREYSEKLKALTSEYLNKTSSSTVLLSVGEEPTLTPGSVEIASVVTWNNMLAQTEGIASDHNKLSNEFDKKVAAKLNGLFVKLDFTSTRINGFNNDLMEKKKNSTAELEKAKKRYDESCTNMELVRNKLSKSNNERNKKKLSEKEIEMNICKNDYLIRINQANRIKDKYYFQDVPESVDLLQDLNEAKILLLNEIWKEANNVEVSFSDNVKSKLVKSNDVISQNKPSLSTAMFIKHNSKNWQEPKDYQYVPSPVWHEDETFAVPSENEAQDLRVKLAQAESEYNRLQDLAQGEMSKLSVFNKTKQTLKADIDTNGTAGDNAQKFYDNLTKYLMTISPFVLHETSKLQAEVAIESIQNNVPDEYDLSTTNIDLNQKKKRSGGKLFSKFKGLNILGDVGGSNNNHKKESSSNGISLFGANRHQRNKSHGTTNEDDDEIASTYSSETTGTSTTGAASAGKPRHESSAPSNGKSNGNKVLFAYSEQDADEISMSLGDQIELIEADSGSGWTKILNATQRRTGLVPTSYVSVRAGEAKKANAPPSIPPPRRHSSMPKRTLTVSFDYEAQDDDEMSVSAGDIVTVIKGDDGSGWTFGEFNGAKGLVPTSYCK